MAFLVALAAPQVTAKKRFPAIILFGTGDDVITLTDVPNDDPAGNVLLLNNEYDQMNLGYKYNTFTIFWMPIHAWGGEFVGVSETRTDSAYYDLFEGEKEAMALAAGYDLSKSGIPFWKNHWGLFVILGLIAGYFYISRLGGEVEPVHESSHVKHPTTKHHSKKGKHQK